VLYLDVRGLRLSDETVRVAVAHRLGCKACEPHTCVCGKAVSACGLACRRSGPRHQRHSQLNDILWRAFKRAAIPAAKEPAGLSRDDGKSPHGVTLLPWAQGKPLAWDVTVPDTYADSHLADTATTAGAAADKAANNKEVKYRQLANSHIFVPVAIESAGTWNHQAVELVQELGRRMTAVTEDTIIGKRLTCSSGCQWLFNGGNAVSFPIPFTTE